jgi:hypothetical protein
MISAVTGSTCDAREVRDARDAPIGRVIAPARRA